MQFLIDRCVYRPVFQYSAPLHERKHGCKDFAVSLRARAEVPCNIRRLVDNKIMGESMHGSCNRGIPCMEQPRCVTTSVHADSHACLCTTKDH